STRCFWNERVDTGDEQIALTWYERGEPLLVHTQPNSIPGRPYGMCTVLVPALGARLTNPERRRGRRSALAEGARRSSLQHLRAGIVRKLDAGQIGDLGVG